AARVLAMLAAVRNEERRPTPCVSCRAVPTLDDDLVAATHEAAHAIVVDIGAAPRAVTTANTGVLIDDEERASDPHPVQIAEHVGRRLRAGSHTHIDRAFATKAPRGNEAIGISAGHDDEHVTGDRDEPGGPARHDRN